MQRSPQGGKRGSELFRAFLEILNLTPNRPTAFVIPALFVGISLLPAQPTSVGWLFSGMPGLPLTIQMSSLSPRSIATLGTIKASPLAPASPFLTTCGMRSPHLDATREVPTGPQVIGFGDVCVDIDHVDPIGDAGGHDGALSACCREGPAAQSVRPGVES